MQLSMLSRSSSRRACSLLANSSSSRRSCTKLHALSSLPPRPSSSSRSFSVTPPTLGLTTAWHKLLGRKFLPPTDPIAPEPSAPAAPPPIQLSQDDLFHPLSSSPFEDLRMRAERIKLMAPCPVCLDHFGERNLVAFDSPEAGWPTHCSEEHWEQDDQHHLYVERLREANEDEHDLRSGRVMAEFENLPGYQEYDSAINFTDWDTFFYTRTFPSMDNMRVFRHMTKVLTYPITIASVLFNLSPYMRSNGRLTKEGERSLSALRATLQPPQTPHPIPGLNNVVRVFVLGARSESALPPANWEQLSRMYPDAVLKIYFIGPQAALPSNWTPDTLVPEFDSTLDPLYDEQVLKQAARAEEQARANGTWVEPEEVKEEEDASKVEPTTSSSSTTTTTAPSSAPASSSSTTTPPPTPTASNSLTSTTPPSSSQLATRKPKNLDQLPLNSPDRQNYPFSTLDASRGEAPISPYIDPSTLSPREGAYGPTFYRPPTPVLALSSSSSGLTQGVPGRDESANYGVPAWTIPVTSYLTLSNIQAPYEQIHEQFGPFDPYSDVFFAFSPGFGFPSSMTPGALQVQRDAEWGETLPLVLETKCPLFVTGFSPADVERDVKSLEGLDGVDGKFDWVLNPGENFFSSERWEVADFDPRVLVKTNWGIWGIRGKMNEIEKVDRGSWGLVDKMTRKL